MVKKTTPKKIGIIVAVFLLFFVILFRNQIRQVSTFLFSITFDKGIHLAQEKSTFNILLLGIGGASHDGPNLTDTIIVASINQSKNQIHLTSIPRDLWLPSLKGKINRAYSDGQDKGNRGIELSKAVAGQVTGLPIDYVIVLDFQGFIKLIDYLGGVDVNVLHTLDDFNYPIDGKENDSCGKNDDDIKAFSATDSAEIDFWTFFNCRYKYVHVDKGATHMNGATALEFVRSRHATGNEGSDFARSQRQQLVIHAIREKIFSLGIILNPIKIIGIVNILKENINTDIKTDEYDDFVKLARKMEKAQILNAVLDAGDSENQIYGLLAHPPISEKQSLEWVLIPRKGDSNFSEIHSYLKCLLDGGTCTIGKDGIISPTPIQKK